ncbi:Aldo/keto reductase [Mycena sp. CBHHK59/15]|nr:Aldo/keto reductase [Mycena sp. CBHHK59/15]
MSASTTTPARRVKYGKHFRLGNSGLKVSQIILGCMTYGSSAWSSWVLGEDEAVNHIKFAYEAGIQTFDTADMYSNGMSEVVLGNAIKKLALSRDEIVVMSKANATELFLKGTDNLGYVNRHGLSRKHIMASVQASLKRLQLEYIDAAVGFLFGMQALHDVVKAGYVRYIGMSSCHACPHYAIIHNLTPFISMQNQYNLIHREEEREMMPSLKHFGVGSIPWSPLARGALTRPYSENTDKTVRQQSDSIAPDDYFRLGAANKAVVQRLEEMVKKHNATMAQVSLAWLMSEEEVTAPIVGTTSLEKLQDLLGALDIKLSSEDMRYLEEPYRPMDIMVYV